MGHFIVNINTFDSISKSLDFELFSPCLLCYILPLRLQEELEGSDIPDTVKNQFSAKQAYQQEINTIIINFCSGIEVSMYWFCSVITMFWQAMSIQICWDARISGTCNPGIKSVDSHPVSCQSNQTSMITFKKNGEKIWQA